MYIYVIRNRVDGKCYVGQSRTPATRWRAHQGHARRGGRSSPLYSAMRKHGVQNFTFEVLGEGGGEEEAKAIVRFRAVEPTGYNQRPVYVPQHPRCIRCGKPRGYTRRCEPCRVIHNLDVKATRHSRQGKAA